MPPLVLDDDEAVAVAVGLRYAAGAAIGGMEESSLRALTKIEQLLPHRLRRRVSALHSSVTSMRWAADDDVVDPESLSVLAAACRDREEVRFDYQRRDGEDSRRLVEPHQLVTAGRRWYLVAWDQRRRDWRTFRLDRLREPRLAGVRFTPREIPGGDAASQLRQMSEEFERTRGPHVPGFVATYMFQTERDPTEHVLVAVFSDRESYRANAADPERDRWYRRWREHMEADPEWTDGEIVFASGGTTRT